MVDVEPKETAGPRPVTASPRSYRWPVTVLLLGLGALALVAYLFHETRSIPGDILEGGKSVVKELRSVAEGFRTGTVTTRFVSYAAEMSGSNYLQFATLEETEVFERTDSATVLWGQLALPDVVVRAEAPVEYTYYLDLEERWDFQLEDKAVLVLAPSIRWNTPAIDVSQIRYDVRSGSILRDEELALRNLDRGLTEMSKRRAQENVNLVRELGRKKTADFIRTWLLSQYEDAEGYRIDVVFRDELPPEGISEIPSR